MTILPFRKPIFFGGENAEHEVAQAHLQLGKAYEMLSALQQPDHPSSTSEAIDNAIERHELKEEFGEMVLSLLTSLGMQDIVDQNKLKEKMRVAEEIKHKTLDFVV